MTSAERGSKVSAETSLTSRAPARRRGFHVGGLAGVDGHGHAAAGKLADDRCDPLDLVAFPDGRSAGASGFTADIDDRRAFRGQARARFRCCGWIGELTAIGEAVGRRVDDAHDLRLVEADAALAKLQRRSGSGQRLPLRRQGIVEAVLDSLDKDEFGGDSHAFHRQQLEAGEPVEPAGEARDLAVMPERGIDEAGGAKACATLTPPVRRPANRCSRNCTPNRASGAASQGQSRCQC